MTNRSDNPIYQALALPDDVLDKGGVEILRAGLINDELYVTARRAFKDPAMWGEALADIARRLALIYSAEDTDLVEQEILVEIEGAFGAELGLPRLDKPARKPAKPRRTVRKRAGESAKRKSAKSGKRAAKSARKSRASRKHKR
jgi:hypothetical protein